MPVSRRGDGIWAECWVDTRGGLSAAQVLEISLAWLVTEVTYHNVNLTVDLAAGTLAASSGQSGRSTDQTARWTWNPLKTPGRFHIGWWLTCATNGVLSVTPVITGSDNFPQPLNTGILGATPVPASAMVSADLSFKNLAAECFQLSVHPVRPATLAEVTQTGTWTKAAVLDMPLFPIRGIPVTSGSSWEVITEIARAMLATVSFDRDGFFRWRNHTRWSQTPTTPDLTVTSARSLAKLTLTEEIDACRNYCTVRFTSWERVESRGNVDIPDTPSPPVAIGAGQTVTRDIWVDDAILDMACPRTRMTENPPSVGLGGVVIRSGAQVTSSLVPGAVEVSISRASGQVSLTLRNRSGSTVYYHGCTLFTIDAKSGTQAYPALWSAWNIPSRGYYGTQVYEHDVKGWVQTLSAAQTLAIALRDAAAFPVPILQSVEILPDPRIELGDVVRVVDRTGTQLDTLAWVIGIHTTASGGHVTQTLTLRGTTTNGVPADAGLTPDPPTRPYAPPPH
ncbi:hypothetical protein AB0901_30950 [Streptomyces roseifaciens]